MLKRKAEFDAKQSSKKTKTLVKTSATATLLAAGNGRSSTAPSSDEADSDDNDEHPSSSIRPSISKKRQHLSSSDKQQHKDLSHYLNKQRTLVLSSRGISYRDRHLLSDLIDLIPQAKKDNKLDTKHSLSILNELALLKNCNNILFLEARKHKDLYLWMSRAPHGPSIKYQLQNIHTMAEVKLTGNHMKYSRPLLLFDSSFDSDHSGNKTNERSNDEYQPHLELMKHMIIQCIGSPKAHPKVKPFIDHILAFFYLDHRIWLRHYQIIYNQYQDQPMTGLTPEEAEAIFKASMSNTNADKHPSILLVEVGPRLVLNPIRIFSGSFGGSTLWENQDFISPNVLRTQLKQSQGQEYRRRKLDEAKTAAHKAETIDKQRDNIIDTVFEQQQE